MKLRTLHQKGQAGALALQKAQRKKEKSNVPLLGPVANDCHKDVMHGKPGKRRKYTARPQSWWIIKCQNTLPSDDGVKTHS